MDRELKKIKIAVVYASVAVGPPDSWELRLWIKLKLRLRTWENEAKNRSIFMLLSSKQIEDKGRHFLNPCRTTAEGGK